jgi:hypothetical protein
MAAVKRCRRSVINGSWKFSSQGHHTVGDFQIADAEYIFKNGTSPLQIDVEYRSIDLVSISVLESSNADTLLIS